MDDGRLQTGLFLDAHFYRFTKQGKFYYVLNTGAYASGIIMLKINMLGQGFKLLIQQRDFDGNLVWENALDTATPKEKDIDEYIKRSIERDPDIWVIEIEDQSGINPFENKD